MANKYRGEVAFPLAGKATFIRFDLSDLANLEEAFGEDFFGTMEVACARSSPREIPRILAIGLKVREGKEEKPIWSDLDHRALQESGFKIGDASRPIMDALSWAWLQKSYDDLVAEAVEARKKADAEQVKRAKEAAEAAGIPFTEALLEGLSKLLTEPGSAP